MPEIDSQFWGERKRPLFLEAVALIVSETGLYFVSAAHLPALYAIGLIVLAAYPIVLVTRRLEDRFFSWHTERLQSLMGQVGSLRSLNVQLTSERDALKYELNRSPRLNIEIGRTTLEKVDNNAILRIARVAITNQSATHAALISFRLRIEHYKVPYEGGSEGQWRKLTKLEQDGFVGGLSFHFWYEREIYPKPAISLMIEESVSGVTQDHVLNYVLTQPVLDENFKAIHPSISVDCPNCGGHEEFPENIESRYSRRCCRHCNNMYSLAQNADGSWTGVPA